MTNTSTHRYGLFPNARISVAPGPFNLVCWAPECELPVADETLHTQLCVRHLREAWAGFEVIAERDSSVWPNGKPLDHRDVTSEDARGVVYFARVGDLIKIGWTSNVKRRMWSINADAVFHTQPGTRHDERALHAKFNHLLVKGREWFRSDPELLAFIKGLR